jgi:hypothetical protein
MQNTVGSDKLSKNFSFCSDGIRGVAKIPNFVWMGPSGLKLSHFVLIVIVGLKTSKFIQMANTRHQGHLKMFMKKT